MGQGTRDKGFVLVMAIGVAFIVLITGLTVIYMAQSNLDIAANLRVGSEVRSMAQGGLDHALLYVRSENDGTLYPQTLQFNQGSYQYTVTLKRLHRPEEKRYEYEVKSTSSGPRNSAHTAHQMLARLAGPPDQAQGFMAQGAIDLDGELTLVNFLGGSTALHSNTRLSTPNTTFSDTVAPLLSISSAATAVGNYTLTTTPPITLRNGLVAEDPKAQIALTVALYTPRNCTQISPASSPLNLYSQTDLDKLWTDHGLSLDTCIDLPADVHIQSAGPLNLSGRKLKVRNLSSDEGSSLNLSNTQLHASDALSFKKAQVQGSTLIAKNLLDFSNTTCAPPLTNCTFSGTNVLVSQTAEVHLSGTVTPAALDQVGLYVYGGLGVRLRTGDSLNAVVRAGSGGVHLDQTHTFAGGIVTTGPIQAAGDLTLRKPQGFNIPHNPSPAPTALRGPVEVLSRR